MKNLLKDIRQCTICEAHLPLGPRPIVSAHKDSKIVIIGQAPGLKVHTTGIPWDDPSGKQLRKWLDVTDELFYDETKIALVPMGFCYPGKESLAIYHQDQNVRHNGIKNYWTKCLICNWLFLLVCTPKNII